MSGYTRIKIVSKKKSKSLTMVGVDSDIGEQVGDSKRFTSHLSFHRGQMTSKKRRDQDGKRCMALCKVKKDNGDQAKGDYYEPRPKKLG